MNPFNEYQGLFLEETEEHLVLLNDSLLALEGNRGDKKTVNTLFRILHTLKSSAAAVGYYNLSDLAHHAEDLVQNIRNGEVKADPGTVDVLFSVHDTVKLFTDQAKKGKEGSVDVGAAVEKIQLLHESAGVKPASEAETPNGVSMLASVFLSQYEQSLVDEHMKQGKRGYLIKIEIDPSEKTKSLRAELVFSNMMKIGEIIRIFPGKDAILSKSFDGIFSAVVTTGEPENSLKQKVEVDLLKAVVIERIDDPGRSLVPLGHGMQAKDESPAPKPAAGNPFSSGDTIRVTVKKLDQLMQMVGELVVANSGMKLVEQRAHLRDRNDTLGQEMSLLTDKLIKITSDLQNSVMKMRMLPLNVVFGPFQRIVRDLSKKQGKSVELAVEGEDTELDKKVIDAIGDPLLHILRNAVDHAIEPPEERERKGKPSQGRILLSASQTGNHIFITVRDDGRGIDLKKVKSKGLAAGLISANTADSLTESDLLQLIFEPGFSTSDTVNAVSGRGVGLDVVATVIKNLNGFVKVQTEYGKGTEFLITLPLTLAISTVIVVEIGGNLFAIPIADIQETLKIPLGQIENKEFMRAVVSEDRVLPVVGLRDLFGDDCFGDGRADPLGRVPVVVVSYKDKHIGIAVDDIIGKQEIVLKPLETHFKSVPGLSGAAVLGDGSVVLVLDVLEVIHTFKRKTEPVGEKRVLAPVLNAPEEGQPDTAENAAPAREAMPPQIQPAVPKRAASKQSAPKVNTRALNDFFRRSFAKAGEQLSMLTGKSIMVSDYSLEQTNMESLGIHMEDHAEECYFASILKVPDLRTEAILLISKREGLKLYDHLAGKRPGSTRTITVDVVAAIGEINNIMGSTFVNQLADMLNREIHPSTPLSTFDMLGAVFEGILLQEEYGDQTILCADAIVHEKRSSGFKVRIILLFDPARLPEAFQA
jgi:two-component system, chemotaxis family, sensor kinase CheA